MNDANTSEQSRPLLEIFHQEALFGYQECAPSLAQQSILEIGAGPGLLSEMLANDGHCVQAVEPIGSGFSETEAVLRSIESARPDIRFHRCGIEDFKTSDRFDLVLAVNSFEHIPDWRGAIEKAYSLLHPGGRAVILCQNYDFPYEGHYGLPVIFGKAFTARIFAKQIAAFDAKWSTHGLWESVNMISLRDVRAFCRQRRIPLKVDAAINVRMVERIFTDPEFAKRQRVLAPLVRAARAVGAHHIAAVLQPYMKLILEKPAGAE